MKEEHSYFKQHDIQVFRFVRLILKVYKVEPILQRKLYIHQVTISANNYKQNNYPMSKYSHEWNAIKRPFMFITNYIG